MLTARPSAYKPVPVEDPDEGSDENKHPVEHLPLLDSWYHAFTTRSFLISITLLVLSFFYVFCIGFVFTHNCQIAAIDRVYGPQRTRQKLQIIADRGFPSEDVAANTIASFERALNYTDIIKTEVLRTVDGQYLIFAPNEMFISSNGIVSDQKCDINFSDLVAAGGNNTDIVTLNETIAFAVARNVTLMIEYYPCDTANGGSIEPKDAAVEMHTIAVDELGLRPDQWWFMYSDHDEAVALATQRNVEAETLIWSMPLQRSFDPWRPKDAVFSSQYDENVTQVDTPINVDFTVVDTWTCGRFNGIGTDTILIVSRFVLPGEIKRIVRNAPARYIVDSNPALVFDIADDADVPMKRRKDGSQ